MASSSPPHVVEDMRPFLQLLSDGTVIRFPDYNPLPSPSPPPDQPVVEWKDVVYDADHNLKLRVYKPPAASCGEKLPVLAYFHGGGYFMGSFEMPNFHACCLRLAGEIPAVVLSADYRLAPEHRLPAALDDAATFLSWVRGQAAAESADPWLAGSADLSRVFVCGDSAGGNIVHHMAVRLGLGSLSLDPARVAGCAMLCPLFGGAPACDQLWRLALPPESTRNRHHPLANPFAPGSPALDGLVLPPMLVVAAERDQLRGPTADYVARLKAMGKPLELVEFEGQDHGFFVIEPYGDAGSGVVRAVKRFVCDDGGATAVSK
ncbi:strigolactones hydrolase CXE15-like [Aegilops tauschii subsp. strangulata]|uniref:Alpha/beta hydrolase fold-3 domain-containing protein n=1 Tax=Aegilops tauschii subsp. strangulata TaxID=200361 RepID=A0A453M0J6_AEGTS|nr:probable carboxylesterase 15 [Aegilops tauschii subsp. strangulata]